MNHNQLLPLGGLAGTLLLLATAPAQTTSLVVPAAQATALGNTTAGFPFSYSAYVRFQQAIGTSHFPSAGFLHAMAFRTKPTWPTSVPETQKQGLRVDLADCATAVNALSTTYANNVGANVKTVFNGSVNIQRPNPNDPLEFNTLVPFDAPYLHVNVAPLLVDLIPTSWLGVQCNGGGNGTTFDAVTDPNIAALLSKSGAGCPSIPTTGSATTAGFVLKFFTTSALYPFGKACAGTSVPQIGSIGGAPTPGNATFAVQLLNAPAGAPPMAALLLGATAATWASQTLPWELSALNMPTCFLSVAIDYSAPTPVAGGTAAFGLPIPNSMTLIGQSLYAQWFSVATGANPFGGVTSQGGSITIR